MNPTERIEIPHSKGKLVKLLLLSLAFVAAGAWLLLSRPESDRSIFNDPAARSVAGGLSILFFGWSGFFFARKLSDKRPAFIIDRNGIEDNSSAFPNGFVPWTDIAGYSTVRVMNQQFLIISVHNPEQYLARQTSFLGKQGARQNYKRYGSPLALSSNALPYNLHELESLLRLKRAEYTNNRVTG
ncbi:STM3941 family protein [Flaviaesturariibacter aridisoli]|uniref:PH domain-containing protein n=1 Tax=Flaviaesturariibacter aridisoli TaxID=2545761 RepID=A0A4R4DY29_9BACT|nr:STM3941 family protein [Flaviaesturariibacter aridisoli]TCZ70441.1 hypothetical protein E0486_10825 [Flaviaesturariibacter aridisoli]